ncbi:linoleate 13S-lipoxygenase 3-1, chloroplastic, partial [Tanacetum coccineum]
STLRELVAHIANDEDLTAILTTIIWLASTQHAVLNFGQYPYGGYILNRPPRMRHLIPDENWWIYYQRIPQMGNILVKDKNETCGLVMQKWWKHIEKDIEKQNCDMSLKNRCGAGVSPYELLAPSSNLGATCRGVPNSVSI